MSEQPRAGQVVLLIAREAQVHLQLHDALQGLRARLLSARTPDEALAHRREHRPTWVISEFCLFHQGGEVALWILRRTPGAKGFFFTVETPLAARGRGYPLPVLFRPCRTSDLRDLLRELFVL